MGASYIGLKIKELRKSKKLTQKQLAEKIGKVESTVRMWELGKNNPLPEALKKLSEVLEVEYFELMKAAGYLEEKSEFEKLATEYMSEIGHIKDLIKLINSDKEQIINLRTLLRTHEDFNSYTLDQIQIHEKQIIMFKELLMDRIAEKERIELEFEKKKELINDEIKLLINDIEL